MVTVFHDRLNLDLFDRRRLGRCGHIASALGRLIQNKLTVPTIRRLVTTTLLARLERTIPSVLLAADRGVTSQLATRARLFGLKLHVVLEWLSLERAAEDGSPLSGRHHRRSAGHGTVGASSSIIPPALERSLLRMAGDRSSDNAQQQGGESKHAIFLAFQAIEQSFSMTKIILHALALGPPRKQPFDFEFGITSNSFEEC